jgi:hypothetical protein
MESLIGSNLDFYKELYNVEGTIHYTDTKGFKRALNNSSKTLRERDSLGDHTILILGFPNDRLNDDNDPEYYYTTFPRPCKILLLHDIHALFLTMAGSSHDGAAVLFHNLLYDKVKGMNCHEEHFPIGTTLQKLAGVWKQPDASYQLRREKHITFVVEVGVSESNRALANNAKIWLEHHESHVTQVLGIAVSHKRKTVSFILWKAAPQEKETRAQHPLRATIDHTVEVTLEEGRLMANGRITLSFEELFERQPRQGTAENNIIFSRRELGGLARGVWELMGILPPPSLPS